MARHPNRCAVCAYLDALLGMRYLWQTRHTLVNDKLTALIWPEPFTPLPQAVQAALAADHAIRPIQLAATLFYHSGTSAIVAKTGRAMPCF